MPEDCQLSDCEGNPCFFSPLSLSPPGTDREGIPPYSSCCGCRVAAEQNVTVLVAWHKMWLHV